MATLLTLVGLLFLCGLSLSNGCKRELLVNVDFPGHDIGQLFSPDVMHCQYLCTQHPLCHFFTFIRPDWTRDKRHFLCYLKGSSTGQPKVTKPLKGITSGFSLKSCYTDPQPCLPGVYHDVDFLGADFRSLFTADYKECQRACTSDPVCQFFTFVKPTYPTSKYRYKCHLKFSSTVPKIPVISRDGSVTSGFSHRVHMTQRVYTACEGKLFSNTDITMHSINVQPAASPEHCQALCSAHPHCTSFTYVSAVFKCHMKGSTQEMITRIIKGFTSGLPERFCQLDNEWLKKTYEGINFPHNDIRYFQSDNLEKCQRTCTEDPNCQFFSYVTNKSPARRLCYLKRVITLPSPPRVNKHDHAVSGFSGKNCYSDHTSGCRRELLLNVDFPGHNIGQLFSPDAKHCQQLCTQHPSCLFFTFIRPDWNIESSRFLCVIKSSTSGQPSTQKDLLGHTSGFSLKPCLPDPLPCLPQVYHDVNFPGADFRSLFTADYEECQRACTSDPACHFFTFLKPTFPTSKYRYKCHLKFSSTVPKPLITRHGSITSGFSHRVHRTQKCNTEWMEKTYVGIDFPHNDIRYFQSENVERCQRNCTENPNCQYFSYVANARRCYLKRVITLPAPPRVNTLVNAVSGFSLKNC
ncbi:Coagulation factor XI [Nibea albiflora]|uniref:Coagulation factor XI n=1 Tax=Nibea albiflora TaxID=240163 RepID=A0ACB7ESP6_NIBAL|nr:Coagulation factor XI [Nibea albiflora]